jgi:hypothetical protein
MQPEDLARLMTAHPFRVLNDQGGNPSGQIVTCPVRVGFLAIDKLYASKKYPSRTPEASATLIVPPSADLSALQNEARRIAGQHFGAALNTPVSVNDPVSGQMVQTTAAKLMRWPWKSQSQNKGKPGYSADGSGIFLRAGSQFLPRVIDAKKNVIPSDDPALYPGMWCLALLRLYAYPKVLPPRFGAETIFGVNVGLVQLQKIGDDARLSSGSNGDDAFGILEHAGATAAAPANVPDASGIAW